MKNVDQIKNLKSLAGSIAHETRNPLSSIQSCYEAVKDSIKQAKDSLDQAEDFLGLISVSANRGLSIIDIILTNINEGEIKKDNFVKTSMSDTVEHAFFEYAFESEEQKELVNLNLKDDFEFFGDETLMIFVLFNLLKNSLYYKAKIDIWLKSDDDFNYLYFKDDGVGIAADKLEHIFDDFFTSDKKGGTGLGLPFCKRVMQAFNGDIACKSVEGEGVEFCLKFSVI